MCVLRPHTYFAQRRSRQCKCGKSIITAILFADTLATVGRCLPLSSAGGMLSVLSPREKSAASAVTITPLFIAGVLLTSIGMSVRTACFDELGRFFAFDLVIRDKHTLVTTGPYAVVRHPAYPAYLVVLAGISLCAFGPGSWWQETQQARTVAGKMVLTMWVVETVRLAYVLLLVMIPREEKLLRKTFGKQWTEYAAKTPYKVIPFVW